MDLDREFALAFAGLYLHPRQPSISVAIADAKHRVAFRLRQQLESQLEHLERIAHPVARAALDSLDPEQVRRARAGESFNGPPHYCGPEDKARWRRILAGYTANLAPHASQDPNPSPATEPIMVFDRQHWQMLYPAERQKLKELLACAELRRKRHIRAFVAAADHLSCELNGEHFKSQAAFDRRVRQLCLVGLLALRPDGYAVRIADARGRLRPLPRASSADPAPRSTPRRAAPASAAPAADRAAPRSTTPRRRSGTTPRTRPADAACCSRSASSRAGSTSSTPAGRARRKSPAAGQRGVA